MKTLIDQGFHVIGTVRKEIDAAALRKQFAEKCTIVVFDGTDVEKCQSEMEKAFTLI